jgi:predicted lipid-binding transport protein (Tim44 family)
VNRLPALVLAAVAATALVTADLADARRLGGGRNLGAQRQSVAPPAATPPSAAPSAPSGAAPGAPAGAASNPVMPAQPGATAARPAPGAAAAPARPASRWLGPIAGLAAGLGLAALAAHLGISEAVMSVLLIALIAFAGFALLRALLARRNPASRPMAYAPSGGAAGRMPAPTQVPSATSFEPVAGAPRSASASGRYPPGFDPVPFLEQSRQQFLRLQAAYDRGDRAALADVMTPGLFAEVAKELDARSAHAATEVVALSPEIVEVTTEGDRHWASVRFRGLLREDGAASPKPFDEMWNLEKPVDGSSGWLLAGIRQLDEAPAGHA